MKTRGRQANRIGRLEFRQDRLWQPEQAGTESGRGSDGPPKMGSGGDDTCRLWAGAERGADAAEPAPWLPVPSQAETPLLRFWFAGLHYEQSGSPAAADAGGAATANATAEKNETVDGAAEPGKDHAGLITSTSQIHSGSLAATALISPDPTFRLHSAAAGSAPVIYLDFDGHITTGSTWNTNTGVSSYTSPAYDSDGDPTSFSTAEREQIRQIWERVAADFAPFDIDVTTQAPPSEWLSRTSSSDNSYGIRDVITSAGPAYGSAGVAFQDSFTWSSETPVFIYCVGVANIAQTISHEVGHTLGLTHDGTTTSAYYGGHGSGEEAWAPIMGSGPSKNVNSWDDGSYSGSNNGSASANGGKGPDDLYVITTYNGISYRRDTEGSDALSAVALSVINGSFGHFGTITTRNDQDFFSFSLTGAASLNLSADPYWSRAYIDDDDIWGGSGSEQLKPIGDVDLSTPWPDQGANLDVSLQLFDASGRLVASSNPTGLRAGFNALALAAGSYTLVVDGVGAGTPTSTTPTGYSDYGSIGNYWLSGSLTGSAAPPPTTTQPILSASDVRVLEGSSGGSNTVQLDVRLSAAASEDVILTFSSRDGSATSKGTNADFAPITNRQLIIPKGQLSALLPLSITADQRSEADEGFRLDFTSISGAVLEKNSVGITIVNDDGITGGGKKSSLLTTTQVMAAPNGDTSTGSRWQDPITGLETTATSWLESGSQLSHPGQFEDLVWPWQGQFSGTPEPIQPLGLWQQASGLITEPPGLSAYQASEETWLMGSSGLPFLN